MAFCSLFLLSRQYRIPRRTRLGPRREAPSIGPFHGLMQAPTAATVALRRSGGTGRRAGLKIRWGQLRVGSSPTFGTPPRNRLAPWASHDDFAAIVFRSRP